MKFVVLTLFSSLFIYIACEPTDRQQAQQDLRRQQLQIQTAETTIEFNNQMISVMDQYFLLKDALVESDAGQAKNSAKMLKSVAEDVKTAEINNETAALWNSFRRVIVSSSDSLLTGDHLEEQRFHFEFISEAMIDMANTFRPAGFTVYHQSCPMVRGGTADWLSLDQEIRNPYHGDRMMNCGEQIRRF